MKTKISSIVLIFLLIVILLIVNFNFFVRADSREIYVRTGYFGSSQGTAEKPYKTIQEAIYAASSGDVINVKEGMYYGDIVIDRSIKITTDNKRTDVSIISANQNTYMIDITADAVVLSGFTIFDETNTSHRKAAVHVSSGIIDVVISDNIIRNCSNGYAIHLDRTTNSVIKNNIIKFFNFDILLS